MKLKQTTSTQRVGRVARFLRENKAVSALEYAILIGVIAVGAGPRVGDLSEPNRCLPHEGRHQDCQHPHPLAPATEAAEAATEMAAVVTAAGHARERGTEGPPGRAAPGAPRAAARSRGRTGGASTPPRAAPRA